MVIDFKLINLSFMCKFLYDDFVSDSVDAVSSLKKLNASKQYYYYYYRRIIFKSTRIRVTDSGISIITL